MVLRGLERGGVERAGLHAGDVGEAHELGGDVRGKGGVQRVLEVKRRTWGTRGRGAGSAIWGKIWGARAEVPRGEK